MNLDKLLEIGTDGAATEVVRGRKHKHPNGWVPGITLGATDGTIVSDPRETAPDDWTALLVELLPPGLDPADFDVDGETVEVRAWDANVGEGNTTRLYYFKARIRRKRGFEDAGIDLDDIIAAAKKAKLPPVNSDSEGRTYCLQLTDLQAGQADGDGAEGMTRRALEIPALVAEDIKALKRMGKPAENVFIAITGDLVENVTGYYEMQTFSVTLDRREQVKLARRLVSEIILSVAKLGLPVHVAVVPGNHGENRQNGKAYTTLNDNDDVALVEQIAEAFALAGIENVTFSFPAKNRLSVTVDVQGWIVGLTHGHVARASGTPAAKLLSWFKSMAATRDPIGDADLLVTGHYHHYIAQQLIGDTWLIQGGALCDTSDWFAQTYGLANDPLINKWTMTRSSMVEILLPYSWNRTKVDTKVLA